MIKIEIKTELFDKVSVSDGGWIDFEFEDMFVSVFDDGDVGVEQSGVRNILYAPQFDEIIRVRQLLMGGAK